MSFFFSFFFNANVLNTNRRTMKKQGIDFELMSDLWIKGSDSVGQKVSEKRKMESDDRVWLSK